jgi:hypothetical protein
MAGMTSASGIEQESTFFALGQHAHQRRTPIDPSRQHRPGEGPETEPSGPVNWYGIENDDYEDTLGALTDFLEWAVPHWNFTTEQFPYGCWWQHSDIIEEMTAWWGMWQAYIRNPAAHPADPIAFHERTHALKQRLADTYRGRCRHGHQPRADTSDLRTPAGYLPR